VIGNEANAPFFWWPQYNADGSDASPAAYEALLARCYDVLHAYRAGINVAAPATSPHGNDNPFAKDNISHSPTTFVQGMAAAYKASGRMQRIFDTVVHHPYGLPAGLRGHASGGPRPLPAVRPVRPDLVPRGRVSDPAAAGIDHLLQPGERPDDPRRQLRRAGISRAACDERRSR